MGFLLPTALATAALAIPIILLYMLKPRRQPVNVSSLMLWQQVLMDQRANAPWQRLKRNLLLLLQLLILALLALALARPYFKIAATVEGNVILLLDASASMQATDVQPSRFAAAQNEAINLVDQLSVGDAATLIIVAQTPQILASTTTDHRQLRQLIRQATVTNGPADWNAGLNLAAANAAATQTDSTIVIISDGAIWDESQGPAPAMPVPVESISIGASANNQGIVALSLRDGTDSPHLYINVYNAHDEPVRRLVEIEADGTLFDARWVDLPPRDSASVTVSGLPQNVQTVEASLTPSDGSDGGDMLAVDDVGWAVRSSQETKILLVSQSNLFLERVLSLLPNVTLLRADPTQPLPNGEFDLLIFDRVDLDQVEITSADFLIDETARLNGNLFFIAPPASTPLFEVDGVLDQPAITNAQSGVPLLEYVSLDRLQVAQAQAITPPPWSRTLIRAGEEPLLMVGEEAGRRVAILSFDLHQSNLPLQIDFPILTVNLAQWLLPNAMPEQGQMHHVNDRLLLPPVPATDRLVIKTSGGDSLSLPADQRIFEQTQSPGVYELFAEQNDAVEPRFLTEYAINFLNQAETDIEPRSITLAKNGGSVANADTDRVTAEWEWWWILVLLGLALLLWEWRIYWQGRLADALY